jgi:hypothetical protein
MKNLILNGTGNNGKRHRYSFNKNEKFKIGYLDLLKKLGLTNKEIYNIENKFTRTEYGENGENEEITIKLKISDINDECWYFKNSKYEIDTFFGNKKIIVIIRIKRHNIREKLTENIIKESEWISEEQIEKRKEKIKTKTFKIKK